MVAGMTSTKTVHIFGCGPGGLIAAHAAEEMGWNVRITSRKIKSVIPGSMHLHGPIPGITSPYPEGTIQFVRLGNAEDYARKVYADSTRETGWDNYDVTMPSWRMPAAYDKLWEMYESRVMGAPSIDGRYLHGYISQWPGRVIISTLPQPAICMRRKEHTFDSVPYWIQPLPVPPGDERTEIVVYNGLPHDFWYRWSILGGLCSLESSQRITAPDAIGGVKAIRSNCDCFSGLIHRVGRWAEWQHGIVLWHTYNKVKEILRDA